MPPTVRRSLGALVAACLALPGCSPGAMAFARMATALSDTAKAYATDDDPEFVRLAAPSTLKMMEMLLDQAPTDAGLLITACSGFTQYAYAFLQVEADLSNDAARTTELRTRAARMYSRARGYCWRALELRHPGIQKAAVTDARSGFGAAQAPDVPTLYWLGAAWGGELSLAANQLLRLPELGAIRALLARALVLDETWGAGSLHEAFIALDGMSPLLGGSAVRAREHFARAQALSGGHSAFAYVALASSVSVSARNREEFERLLHEALAVDVNARPALRLTNLIAQRQARAMLAQGDGLFGGR